MIATKKNRNINLSDDDSTIWISISDLMAGLLIIFILTLTYFILSYTEKTDYISKNQSLKEKVLKDIKEQMESKGFNVKLDEEQWVLRLDLPLFDSCGVDLKNEGKRTVEALGKVMHSEFIKDEYKNSIETVFIEGHTDAAKISKGGQCKYNSNWELSAQRAINTWLGMKSNEPRLDELKNQNKERLFSVSGYGKTRPLNKNWSKRALNRRIDVRIAMNPPSIENKPEIISEIKRVIANNILGSNGENSKTALELLKELELMNKLESQ
ncbi:MAG: OmpA family protein [Bdellovibrionales bacterium]|nr:OmpA family protein [Bdellovibrionales bacterium]